MKTMIAGHNLARKIRSVRDIDEYGKVVQRLSNQFSAGIKRNASASCP